MTDNPSPASAPSVGRTVIRLLRKEWAVFDLRGRLSVFGVFTLAAIQVVHVDEVYLFLGLALAGSLAVYVPVVEWFQETDPMLHSLPVDRDTVVLARYGVAILAGTLAGIVWNAAGRILLPVLDAGRVNPSLWMTLDGVLTFALALGFMAALFFPLYFRLGMGRASVTFLGLSLILLALAYATAGWGWGPAAKPAGPAAHFLAIPPSALIRTRVSALLSSLGVAGTLTLVLVGLALLFFASIRISQHALRKREI
jgi:hypothetical protein